MGSIDWIFILSASLAVGLGHCIGMCGGIVMAYASAKGAQKGLIYTNTGHLLYNLGRISSYIFLGAIVALLTQSFGVNALLIGLIFILTGLLMIIAGVSLLGKSNLLNRSLFGFSEKSLFKRLFTFLLEDQSLLSYYLLGVLNGLIPCGPLYGFLAIAAASASVLDGALIMFIFGVGTTPALWAFANISQLFQKGSMRQWAMRLSALLIMGYGVFTLVKGYKFVSEPQKMQKRFLKHAKGVVKHD